MRTPSLFASVAAIAALSTVSATSQAESRPTKVGQCVTTSVSKVGTRLEGAPGSGTSITFSNGIYLVDYETVPAAEASKHGDKVKLCLKSLPTGCPPGDSRGKMYTATNLRTNGSFTLPDSEHACGGA